MEFDPKTESGQIVHALLAERNAALAEVARLEARLANSEMMVKKLRDRQQEAIQASQEEYAKVCAGGGHREAMHVHKGAGKAWGEAADMVEAWLRTSKGGV